MLDERCPKCGALYSMVGRVHNCRPNPLIVSSKPPPIEISDVSDPTNWDVKPVEPVKPKEVRKSRKVPKPVEAVPKQDKPKFDRNAYQRDYMRKYRKKKKGDGK